MSERPRIDCIFIPLHQVRLLQGQTTCLTLPDPPKHCGIPMKSNGPMERDQDRIMLP